MANEFGPTLERLGVLRDLGEPPRIMNPTYRDRAISATAPVMQWWQSLSPANKELTESQAKAQALKSTKRIFGDIEAENIMDSLGILDFTPAGLVFAGQEAYREFGEAEKPTDYILPTVGLGLSGLEAYPLTKPLVSTATRPLRKFLSNLSSKTSEPIDVGRRKVVGGIAATPIVAGALSEIPLGKVVDEIVPAVKKKFLSLPKSRFDLPALIEQVDEIKIESFEEGLDMYSGDELKEILNDLGYEDAELIKMGIDPKNVSRADFSNDEIIKTIKESDLGYSAPDIDSQDILEENKDEILDYLDGEIEMDDLNSGTGGPYNLIESLQNDYGLDKNGIKSFLFPESPRLKSSTDKFNFKNTDFKKPKKFDSLTDSNKQKVFEMTKDPELHEDDLQSIVDELREEEKFWGAG